MQPTKRNNTHADLGFSYLETAEIVVKLNVLLSNYQVHFHRLQTFAWNIKGPSFFDLHKEFTRMYHDSFEEINSIAERVRVFNQCPVSQMKDSIEVAQLEDSESQISGQMMVQKVQDDLTILLSFLIEGYEMAKKNGDVGSVDLITSLIKRIERDHWKLNAWSESNESRPVPAPESKYAS